MINLRAVLKLDDNFSSPMQRIERQIRRTEKVTNHFRDSTGRLRDSMGRFVNEGNRAHLSLSKIGSGAGKALRGITSLKSGLLGVAAAAGGAYAAVKVFDNTVGEAMKFEQSSIMIDAMFDNKKVSNQYKQMMQKMAIDSPLLNSQDIFGNSKSFIMLTKNNKQLKQMWSLVERLNSVDPAQGVEGAVFALKELFSGDSKSMTERFELDRKTLNGIKNLPLKEQLKALDKYFNKMGVTQKLINKMGGTTLGLWNQVQEQFQLVLRQMGEPSLKVLKNFFSNILDKMNGGELNKFAQVGGNIIKNILTGLTNGTMAIYNWFSTLTNSEEYKRQTTISGKVKFIIEDIFKRFQTWYDGGGREGIEKMATSVTDLLATSLNASIPRFIEIGVEIGSGIGKGILKGIGNHLAGSIAIKSSNDTSYGKKRNDALLLDPDKYLKPPTSHASGLTRVPYDGYTARLHKNERILTPEESKAYNEGRGGGNTYNFSFTPTAGSTKEQAKEMFEYFVKQVELAGGNGA